MRHRLALLTCLVAILIHVQGVPAAQMEAPLNVGPLGAQPNPAKPIHVPPEIASLLPQRGQVCAIESTAISPDGETTVVYGAKESNDPDEVEDTDETETAPHIALVRDGEVLNDLAVGGSGYLAALQEFQLNAKTEAAMIAFRSYGDGAGTDFYLLGYVGGAYVLERVVQT